MRLAGIILLLCSFVRMEAQPGGDTINRLDDNGMKQGYWMKKNEEGKLVYKGAFLDDRPVGEFTYYFPDLTVRARSWFSEQGSFAKTITYQKNGKMMSDGFYRDHIKDSAWSYYNEQEVLISEEHYRNYKKHGVFKSYYVNGKTAEEVFWKDDRENGPWKQYYPDGKLKSEGEYSDGKKTGLFRYFYANGQLNTLGMYEDSFRTGRWIYYSPEGTLVKYEYYDSGYIFKTEEFEKIE
ncbi:MAG: toxin-antitoxin system YwqK family antitoxin [Bacteroidales bacterium]|nr:toxin-antitoxin system YwqK family antitoxin [Bacteroidales bacterium]